MTNFIYSVKNKDTDIFLKDLKNEFSKIREELSLTETIQYSNIISANMNSKGCSTESFLNINEEDVVKEFEKLREELSISAFSF